MEAFIVKVFNSILDQGLSLTFSCIAVYYLNQKIKDCERDRKALWERLLSYGESNETKKD